MTSPLVARILDPLTRLGVGRLPMLVWRLDAPTPVIASAVVGGGLGRRSWVVNAQVVSGYAATDHAATFRPIRVGAGLRGAGVGMLTAADVTRCCAHHTDGVAAWATVGLGHPTWAASPESETTAAPTVGTINVVVAVPALLDAGALVNAVGTATEAKTQALLDAGVVGTGTATDALCIVCAGRGDAPADRVPAAFAGPRSRWGSRIAQATYAAVRRGAIRWQESVP